jgi:hypothetical protein
VGSAIAQLCGFLRVLAADLILKASAPQIFIKSLARFHLDFLPIYYLLGLSSLSTSRTNQWLTVETPMMTSVNV